MLILFKVHSEKYTVPTYNNGFQLVRYLNKKNTIESISVYTKHTA